MLVNGLGVDFYLILASGLPSSSDNDDAVGGVAFFFSGGL